MENSIPQEFLDSPDVSAGRMCWRICNSEGEEGTEFLVIRWLADNPDPIFQAFLTFSDAVDCIEADSVRQSIWYGEPTWHRVPEFSGVGGSNGKMKDRL